MSVRSGGVATRWRAGLERGWRRIGRADLLIAAAFAAFAILYFLDVSRGDHPYVYLRVDASNIAGFAAALDHPELFAGDGLLADSRHFSYYRTIHVPLLRGLAPLFGDYGTAFLSLLPIHVFLQALGFYVLGRVLFPQRLWAAILAILNLAPMWLGFGTYWGLDTDPLPRFTFQAVLPFLLAAAVRWRRRPERWPWLMIGIGLLTYVHPVSAPAWAFALWLGLCFALPERLKRPGHLFYLVALGLVCLLISTPFVIWFVGAAEAGGESYLEEVEEIRQSDRRRVEYQDVGRGIWRFLRFFTKYELLFWAAVAIGTSFLAWVRPGERSRLAIVIHWVLGIGFVSVLMPFAEQEICRALDVPPTSNLTILLRSLRYSVPLGFLLCTWSLAVMERISQGAKARRAAVTAVGLLIAGYWLVSNPPLRLGWAENWHSQGTPGREARELRIEALDAVRHQTAPKSRILARDLQLELRYYALRPVVWALHDSGALSHTDPDAFVPWSRIRKEFERIRRMPSSAERLDAWRRLGARLDADYLLLRHGGAEAVPGGTEAPGWREVWRNGKYVLVESLKRP